MNTNAMDSTDRVWAAIESEKRRDRFIRRVSIAAWSFTFLLLLALGVLVGMSVAETMRAVAAGALPWMSVVGIALPFVVVVGAVSLLIATLSTVGVFLRMRTTTLSEIQLRLSALEAMLMSRTESR